MKQTWRVVAITLLLVTLATRCSSMDGPEAAAKTNFSEWAVKIRVPYRNENFQTTSNDGTVATVHVTVEVKRDGEWIEKQLDVQCEKADNDWQCGRSFQFK